MPRRNSDSIDGPERPSAEFPNEGRGVKILRSSKFSQSDDEISAAEAFVQFRELIFEAIEFGSVDLK